MFFIHFFLISSDCCIMKIKDNINIRISYFLRFVLIFFVRCVLFVYLYIIMYTVWFFQVTFIAVNCWEPSGNCATEGSLTRYPAIAVYTRGLLPIVYDGPIRADYLSAFVRKTCHPLKVIHSKDYMQYLHSRYDVSYNGIILSRYDILKNILATFRATSDIFQLELHKGSPDSRLTSSWFNNVWC